MRGNQNKRRKWWKTYQANKCTFTFQQLERIRSFGHSIFNDGIKAKYSVRKNLEFNNKARIRSRTDRQRKTKLLKI